MEQNEAHNIEEETNDQAKYSGQDTNRIMGMAAIFISVLSMIAVIYQSYLAREENELMRIQQSATVLPYLSHWYSDIEGEYKFVVANKGVGPAFIKEVKLIALDAESKDSSLFNSSHALFNFIKEQSVLLDTTPAIKYSLKPNILLSKNETVEVYSFSYKSNKHQELIKKEFKKIFIGFNIVYEDVYGTAWMLDSNIGFPKKLKAER